MNQPDDQHKIDDLRRRLYSRGDNFNQIEEHQVSDVKVDVSRDWQMPSTSEETASKPSRRYRWYIILGSLLVLLVTAAITGFYMFSGGNQISSENISINISAGTSLGGGERFDAQIGVTNQNTVAIESATLIVSYPQDSQSVAEPVENLFEERIWIDTLAPGEARNIPISAVVYGEEGEERQLRAQLEYRIENSDSLFYKDATPHGFRITSSPITMQVTSVRKVSAGQEVEVAIDITSNTNTEFNELLITAEYPRGFTYISADPEPAFNQNVWKIDSLKPEETKTVTVKGTIVGIANEALRLNVKVGPSEPDNQYIAGATLTDSYTEFVIERPFIDVLIDINDQRTSPVVLETGDTANIQIAVTNTLDESVYDMVVEVVPSGSAVSNAEIFTSQGFYNSNNNTVRFDASRISNFTQFLAGQTENLNLRITPNSSFGTANFSVAVNIYGRRVNDPSAEEQLFGTTNIEARYASSVDLDTAVLHVGGPIPPIVGEETTYQVVLSAKAGTNDVTNGVLRTSLPVYVEWLGNYQADGVVDFNPVTRDLEWQAGSINGAQKKDFRFTVSYTPSESQSGSTPTLIEEITYTAKDRFTGTELSASEFKLRTDIGANGEVEEGSGRVQSAE